MSATGLRIGITTSLDSAEDSMWINGIRQNAVYLAEALRHVPSVASVQLVNTHDARLARAPWDTARWPLVTFEDAKDNLDILIELGAEVGAERTSYIKQRGTRLVSYCCGVEYVNMIQAILFNRPAWGRHMHINQRYDGVWVIPQVAPTSLHYFQTLRRRPVEVVPFIWHPAFLRERSRELPHAGEYHPRPGARRVCIMEPNGDVVKCCVYPALIVEEAYRRRPQSVASMQITNTGHLANHQPEFTALMLHLDIVQHGKAIFAGRHETPRFLAEDTDVMVSHQWGNPLNYFYFEVCWQGYPLVHNAGLCADLGYYYPDNDVQAGCEQLLTAMAHHDDVWQTYRDEQRRIIARHLPGDAALTDRYAALLASLMDQPLI